MDQNVRLVCDVACRSSCWELKPVVADDNVLIRPRLCIGDNAVGAGIANVCAVQRNAARVAVEYTRSNGVKDLGDGALGAARGRLEVLLHVGAGRGSGRRVGGILLGDGDGGIDRALLGAAAVALDVDALGLGGLAEGGVHLGRLDAVDCGLHHVGVVQDLTGDLVAVGFRVAEGTRSGDVEVATSAEVVQLCGIPLNFDRLSGLDCLEGRVAQVLRVDVETQAGEGNFACCSTSQSHVCRLIGRVVERKPIPRIDSDQEGSFEIWAYIG